MMPTEGSMGAMLPVRRMRASALTVDGEGRWCLGGEPFSGLAYHVNDAGDVTAIDRVDRGAVVGPSDDWLDVPAGGDRVLLSALYMEFDYGPLLRDGTPFTGVAYTFFESGSCAAETVYQDGEFTHRAERRWYPSGALRTLFRDGEETGWFEDGRLQRKRRNDWDTVFSLFLREDGRLGGIEVADASLLDLDTIRALPFSDDLVLAGKAIDDHLLSTFGEEPGMRAVRRLSLVGSSVSRAGLLAFTPPGDLTKLHLWANKNLTAADADAFQKAHPACAVEYVATLIPARTGT